jgi:uncharacterized repeat protein (TIGR03803 family)
MALAMFVCATASRAQSSTLQTAYSFSALNEFGANADGAHCWAGLLDYGNGIRYGVAADGGLNGTGTIFSITASGQFNVVYTFSAVNPVTGFNPEGAHPYAILSEDANGNIYGTTDAGGAGGTGAIFEYTPASGKLTKLHSFSPLNASSENYDGAVPNGGVMVASDGNLYGTASFGGAHAAGTIYKLNLSNKALTVLHTFPADPGDGVETDAPNAPFAPLVEYPAGTLWGTLSYGGQCNNGAIFTISMSPSVFKIIHTFAKSPTSYVNTDGSDPSGLVVTPSGTLVLTAAYGGSGHAGTICQITPSDSNKFKVLHQFDALDVLDYNVEGGFPSQAIVDSLGNIYYTVCSGGSDGYGGIMEYTGGSVVMLAPTFPTQGSEAHGPLVLTAGGVLYGTTTDGGANGTGSIFSYALTTAYKKAK